MRKVSLADAVRLCVGLLVFGLLLWWVGPGELVSAFTNVIWFWIVIRVAPYAASLWIQARRWKIFLRLEGIEIGTNRLFRRVWMSRFFANTLPGSIGGDIFRVVESADFSTSRMAVARSVLLDRIVALVSLVAYTSVACMAWAWQSNRPTLLWLCVACLCGSIFGLLLLATQWPSRVLRLAGARLSEGRLQNFLIELADSMRDLAGRPGLLLAAALITILYNVTWAISSYFAFLALGVSISPVLVIGLIPVVYAVTALPISINGLGVTEGVFVLVFSAAGLQPADAAAVAILLRVTGLLMSGFGGLFYLAERRKLRQRVAA